MSDDWGIATDPMPDTMGTSSLNGVLSDEQRAIDDKDENPEVQTLVQLFKRNIIELQWFIQRGRENEKIRFNRWLGQSKDQRKHGDKAFPYDGASDMKVMVIEIFIRYVVSNAIASVKRMRVTAIPAASSFSNITKARKASDFMRWMVAIVPDWIPEITRYVNHLCDYGVSLVTPYWKKETVRTVKCLYLDDLPQEAQDAINDPDMEDTLVYLLYEQGTEMGYEFSSEKHARKVLQDLRDKGEAEVHRVVAKTDRAAVFTLSPIEDCFFPANCLSNIQTSPYYFQVIYYPVKDLRAKCSENVAKSDRWDPEWVDYAEKYLVGKDSAGLIFDSRPVASDYNGIINKLRDTVQVIHCFQKMADEFGVVGVYETIFSCGYKIGYARKGLSPYEHGMYPIEASKLEETNKRLYDSRGLPEILEGVQNNYKLEVDANNDRNSWATFPPRLRLIGRESSQGEVMPGGEISIRRENEISFLQLPSFNPGSTESKVELMKQGNLLVGRPGEGVEPQEATIRLQYTLDIIADGVGRIIGHMYKLWKQYGPEKVFYQVLGTQDFLEYKKDEDNDEFNFTVMLENQSQDWEQLQGQVELMIKAASLDPTVAGAGALVRELFNIINPSIADRVIQPGDEAQAKSVQEENTAIAQVSSGINVDIEQKDMKNQIKAQTFFQWLQTPAGQSMAQSQVIGPAVQHRAQQWQQAMTQVQNAQIGQYGNKPSGQAA